MGGLNRDSRQSIFFSVGYTIASEWPSDTMHRLDFQKALAENQLDFPQTSVGVRDFTLVRKEPSALQIKFASVGPRVSSVLVSSDRPAHSLEYFCKEADVVCNAYREMFIRKECQILRCGVTIRQLYSCEDHAFKYLWEERLGQKPELHYIKIKSNLKPIFLTYSSSLYFSNMGLLKRPCFQKRKS